MDKMMLKDIFETVAYTILIPAIPIVGALLIGWLKEKYSHIKVAGWDIDTKIIWEELDTAVAKFQPLADQFKANGSNITPEQKDILHKQVSEYLATTLKTAGIDLAKRVPTELLNQWISDKVADRAKSAETHAAVLANAPVAAPKIING